MSYHSISDNVRDLEDERDELIDKVDDLKHEIEELEEKVHYCVSCQALIDLKK